MFCYCCNVISGHVTTSSFCPFLSVMSDPMFTILTQYSVTGLWLYRSLTILKTNTLILLFSLSGRLRIDVIRILDWVLTMHKKAVYNVISALVVRPRKVTWGRHKNRLKGVINFLSMQMKKASALNQSGHSSLIIGLPLQDWLVDRFFSPLHQMKKFFFRLF